LGPSWSWLHGSWIYNYLCNQCLSPLKLWGGIKHQQTNKQRCDTSDHVCFNLHNFSHHIFFLLSLLSPLEHVISKIQYYIMYMYINNINFMQFLYFLCKMFMYWTFFNKEFIGHFFFVAKVTS
jgi:hypothetical protein